MFGMKRRAQERDDERKAQWEACTRTLPLNTYDVDGELIEAAGYDVTEAGVTFWLGRNYPEILSPWTPIVFPRLHKTAIREIAAGQWKSIIKLEDTNV